MLEGVNRGRARLRHLRRRVVRVELVTREDRSLCGQALVAALGRQVEDPRRAPAAAVPSPRRLVGRVHAKWVGVAIVVHAGARVSAQEPLQARELPRAPQLVVELHAQIGGRVQQLLDLVEIAVSLRRLEPDETWTGVGVGVGVGMDTGMEGTSHVARR